MPEPTIDFLMQLLTHRMGKVARYEDLILAVAHYRGDGADLDDVFALRQAAVGLSAVIDHSQS